MPEPLLEETITDVDRDEPGELEIDALLAGVRDQLGHRSWQTGVEVEWGVTSRLGLAAESGTSRADADDRSRFAGATFGASYAVLHDVARDLHAQLEAGAHVFGDHDAVAHEPGDTQLPYGLALRGGWRRGWATLRPAVGVSIGATSPHLPLRAAVALLGALPRAAGFCGVELGVDGGRAAPLFVALDVLADPTSLGVPFRLGVALPWTPRTGVQPSTFGVFLRAIAEID
ncbi:MAG: hypothetical protein NVSMB47_16400 [Polyangiales bacterium]